MLLAIIFPSLPFKIILGVLLVRPTEARAPSPIVKPPISPVTELIFAAVSSPEKLPVAATSSPEKEPLQAFM
jgi:hypothetical protein